MNAEDMSNSAPPGVTRRQLLEGVAVMSLISAMPPMAKAQALAPGRSRHRGGDHRIFPVTNDVPYQPAAR